MMISPIDKGSPCARASNGGYTGRLPPPLPAVLDGRERDTSGGWSGLTRQLCSDIADWAIAKADERARVFQLLQAKVNAADEREERCSGS